jgi:hypothetical protein
MKSKRANQLPGNTTINTTFNAPVANAYINSTVEANTNFVISATVLQDIERISLEHPELQTAAAEVTNAPQGAGGLQKVIAWAGLANSVTGLAEKIHQHYPKLEAFILSLKHLA